MKVIIYLHCGRPTACADTFNLFEREHAVRSGLLVADAQRLPAMLKQLVSAPKHAADIGADLNVVLPRRLRAQHGVVADYVPYFEFRQTGFLRQMRDQFITDVADFILAVEQHRDEKGPARGVLFHLLVEEPVEFFGNDHL